MPGGCLYPNSAADSLLPLCHSQARREVLALFSFTGLFFPSESKVSFFFRIECEGLSSPAWRHGLAQWLWLLFVWPECRLGKWLESGRLGKLWCFQHSAFVLCRKDRTTNVRLDRNSKTKERHLKCTVALWYSKAHLCTAVFSLWISGWQYEELDRDPY